MKFSAAVETSCVYKLFTTIGIFNSEFKKAEISRKIMKSEFHGNMHIYTLCLNIYKVS